MFATLEYVYSKSVVNTILTYLLYIYKFLKKLENFPFQREVEITRTRKTTHWLREA